MQTCAVVETSLMEVAWEEFQADDGVDNDDEQD
jgi:hypothetical protein